MHFKAIKLNMGYIDMFRGDWKVLNRRGIARAVVLLAVIALALIIAIAVPLVLKRTQSVAKDVDALYIQAAEDDAYLRWVQDGRPFSAIYDSENKRFIDIEGGMKKVDPYGTSKEHEGMVVYVKVDANGNIKTRWVYQDDETIFK